MPVCACERKGSTCARAFDYAVPVGLISCHCQEAVLILTSQTCKSLLRYGLSFAPHILPPLPVALPFRLFQWIGGLIPVASKNMKTHSNE